MGEVLKFGDFIIEPVITEMEINFIILNSEGYQY